MALLIPTTTSNVELDFSVLNLMSLPLITSRSKANIDCFMRIYIYVPDIFENSDVEKMVVISKRSHDNRHLDL